jgi:phage host-nuclease inhibitor protein Gam
MKMENDIQENLKRSEVSILEKNANATLKVNSSLESLVARIQSLENSFQESSESSKKISVALNLLTGALVLVGAAQVAVALCT